MHNLTLRYFTGAAIIPYLDSLARLRIQVFHAWPYLYDGDMDYEVHYLQTYSRSPASFFVLVFDDKQVVGAATGVPMADASAECKQPWDAFNYELQQLFYFGESVLLKAYRRLGIGGQFFHAREQYARELGCFTHTVFCAVERPLDHPQRPPDAIALDAVWNRRGYIKQSQLRTFYSWKDLHETTPTPKPMIFWIKRLDNEPAI